MARGMAGFHLLVCHSLEKAGGTHKHVCDANYTTQQPKVQSRVYRQGNWEHVQIKLEFNKGWKK